MLSFAPSHGQEQRRRLFHSIQDRGRLVQDTVLLGLEVRIPHEGFTAAALLDWVGDADFSDRGRAKSHVPWAKVAADCREAVLVEGRNARAFLAPFPPGVCKVRDCCAYVLLSNGAECFVYSESRARVDDTIAILQPHCGDVSEVRYRFDESLEVSLADGSRIVKRPRDGLIFHEDVHASRHVGRCCSDGACFEAGDGSVAEVWHRSQGSKGNGVAATSVVTVFNRHGVSMTETPSDPEAFLGQNAAGRSILPPRLVESSTLRSARNHRDHMCSLNIAPP